MRAAIAAIAIIIFAAVARAQFVGGMSGVGGGIGLGGGGGGGGAACAGNLVLDYTSACNLMTQMTGF